MDKTLMIPESNWWLVNQVAPHAI